LVWCRFKFIPKCHRLIGIIYKLLKHLMMKGGYRLLARSNCFDFRIEGRGEKCKKE
jgi:hypothetical protein